MPSPKVAVALLLAVAACRASGSQVADEARIRRVTESLLPAVVARGAAPPHFRLADMLRARNTPGVSIAVADSGRIVWARGFGMKEAGTIDSVTATTLFQAGSISKPVAATAMLHLVEQGIVALDSNVNKYLTSWKLPDNAFTATEKVTLRHIVSHNAALTVHGFPGYAVGDPVPTLPQVLDGAKPANTAPVRVDTVPGTIWRYSGGGTTVMQLLLGDVTGLPFPQLLRELVLTPAGMVHSTYEQPLPASRAREASAAHRADGRMIPGRWHVYPEMAAAGLWTTPTDLLKWALAIAGARAGKPSAILSRSMAIAMLTVQTAPTGLGPFLNGTGAGFNFGHDGADEGFQALLAYFPETGQGAAIMVNSDAGGALLPLVRRAIAAEYHWPEAGPREVDVVALTPAQRDGIVGTFEDTAQHVTLTLTRDKSGRVTRVAVANVKADRQSASPPGRERRP